MSKSVSALRGKVAQGDVTVSDTGLRGMISLRGDLADKTLQASCATLTGAVFPAQGKASLTGVNGLLWMSPDEVLLLIPYEMVPKALAVLAKALEGQHHQATNVSDARALMTVQGPFAREVAAKLAPIDLHADSFKLGDFRRTRLGQVAAAIWMQEDETLGVICFRSVAAYTFDLLVDAANAGPVGHLPAV